MAKKCPVGIFSEQAGRRVGDAGNYVYKGGNLQFFNHAEGYVEPDSSGGYDYIYQYKDHLGNIRLAYTNIGTTGTPNLEIREENNYYPFGLKHKGYNNAQVGSDHKYGFGGKEEQDEIGLEWLDFSARNYDASLGRWFVVDALANHENQIDKSPYAYAWNNPINYTDPDGNCPECPDEVYVPIAEHVYGAQVGDVSSNGWEVVRVNQNEESGFQGALYKGNYEGKTEYIYATAGTQDLKKDAVQDAKQLIGTSEQYSESVSIAENVSGEYEGVSYTGHSLGGGLASANALATEGKAVTFNAAGLSKATKDNLNLSGKTADITSYIVKGEAVDFAQKQIGIQAEGNTTIYLPATGSNKIENHMMSSVKAGFRIHQQILNGPHNSIVIRNGVTVENKKIQ